jgi:hypothetical protein
MRLIWKKYDSDPTVTVVGAGFLVGGIYGLAQIIHALTNPVVWAFAAIPLIVILVGAVTLLREYQLWKAR